MDLCDIMSVSALESVDMGSWKHTIGGLILAGRYFYMFNAFISLCIGWGASVFQWLLHAFR